MTTKPLRDATAVAAVEYRCCFCDATTWMPDVPGYNGIMHEGCPEGGTWVRSLTMPELGELMLRIDQLADDLSGALGTLALESEPLTPERRALIEQAKTQADALFELTGKICDPG